MAEQDEEKTEAATPRKRQEARAKGQVPMSTEMIAAALLGAWTLALTIGGGRIATSLGAGIRRTIEAMSTLGNEELSIPAAASLLSSATEGILPAFLAILVPLFAVGLLVGYGQVGFQIAPKAVGLEFSKLDPIKGFGKLFSVRSAVRTALAALKLLFIGATMVGLAYTQIGKIVVLAGTDVRPAIAGVGHVAIRCVAGALAAILALAVFDLLFQRSQHERDLKMSKKEVKDENKTTEGDPQLKARIRRVQREMATRRMMDDVPTATVVVTNPTHYAVALTYDREAGGVPTVVAKGVDSVAQRIKQVAREAGVVLYEDVPLARALHAQVEIGDEIPLDLYQAVASVLAYVFRIQGRPVTA